MSSPTAPRSEELDAITTALGEAPRTVQLIRQNKYCRIFRAEADRGPLIVKRYIEGSPTLERSEARGLELYETLSEAVPELLVGRLEAFDSDARILATTFLHGELMSSVLRRAISDSAARRNCLSAMETIGRVLVALRSDTRVPGATPDPFLLEYLTHVTKGLQGIPAIGGWLASTPEPQALFDAMLAEDEPPSFSHGDLVFANLLISGSRVGMIDFGNALEHAHTLNDLYGLRISLDAKPLPRAFRAELNQALARGLGDREPAPRAFRDFYRELHRRRWLYLQLRESGPRGIAGVLSSWPRLRRWARA